MGRLFVNNACFLQQLLRTGSEKAKQEINALENDLTATSEDLEKADKENAEVGSSCFNNS